MNVNIKIGEILTKSWQIVWKFKVLWIFGILAGFAGGSNRFNYSGGGSGSGGSAGNNEQLPEFFRRFENMQPGQVFNKFLEQSMTIIALVIMFLCVLWFLFYFLSIMGKIGLIKGASKADAGAEKLSFGELWTDSTPYFLRMFGLNLLIGVPFFILFVILIAGLGLACFTTYKSGITGGGLATVVIGLVGVFSAMICVISILSIIVGMVVEQAQNAIVLEDLGVFAGLSRGWKVFKSGVVSVIIMALILGLIGWISGLLITIPIIAIAIPAGVALVVLGSSNFIIPLVIASGCFLLYLPVLLLASGIFQSFIQSVWTLTYRQLTAVVLPANVEIIEFQ